MKKEINIGIGCIGSGVAQSIVNSCRLSKLPIRTIGFGNNPWAYGAYDCDKTDYLPDIHDQDYGNLVLNKCIEHEIDLYIPSLDHEVYVVSKYLQQFKQAGIKLISPGVEVAGICNDKMLLNDLQGAENLFVKSWVPDQAKEAASKNEISLPLISKPRFGSASRGIHIKNETSDFELVPQDSIIQEYILPVETDPDYSSILDTLKDGNNPQLSEYSFQLVFDAEQKLIGRFCSRNKLQNGIPIEIMPVADEKLWNGIDKLIPLLKTMGHTGPLNLQGRFTGKEIKIFEMNARFTGISYTRALMGFNEVEACIKAFLQTGNSGRSLSVNPDRFGVRQLADKAISYERNKEVKKLKQHVNKDKHAKTLLITGAGGYLGRNLISCLADNYRYHLMALSRDKNKIREYFKDFDVNCFSLDDYYSGNLQLGNVDTLIHCAFARPHYQKEDISASLKFTGQILADAALHQIPEIINISSQSVYGNNSFNKSEKDPVSPETSYGQAKYASELMLETAARINNQSRTTSLRLSSLSGGQPGFVGVDLLSKFVDNALESKPIVIYGGEQIIERLDVRDAVRAICALLEYPSSKWQKVYNVGSDKTYNIVEIAEKVIASCKKYRQISSEVIIKHANERLKQGMEVKQFKDEVGWSDVYTLEHIIESIIEFKRIGRVVC